MGNETGGCAWDNQALFDFGGHPLPVLSDIRALSALPVASAPQPEESADPAEEAPNLVLNPGFEEADRSMWETSSKTGDIPYDFQDFVNDAHSGTVAFHFWSEQDMAFSIQQTVEGLEPGQYEASVWSQGGDITDAAMELYVIADGECRQVSFMNTSWADWQHPVLSGISVTGGSVTIGVSIRCGKKSWGTLDDFSLVRLSR